MSVVTRDNAIPNCPSKKDPNIPERSLQEGKAEDWQCVADTGMSSPSDFCEVGQEKALTSLSYLVKARSVVVLLRTA